MSSSLKLILATVIVAALGFFGYQYVSGTPVNNDLTKVGVSDTSKMGAQVLSALNQLQQLKLDGSVFDDKTFKSLKDFSRPLPLEDVGRINPFAPIGIDSTSVKNTNNSTSSGFSVFGQTNKATSSTATKSLNRSIKVGE